MDSKTVIMFGAAAASLWALQQIKETQGHTHKKLAYPPASSGPEAPGEDPQQNVYVLTRIADAYAQAAERETDLLQKLSHWQAAKNAIWVAKLLWKPDDPSLEEKFGAYSDMEAGIQNQIRQSMAAAPPPAVAEPPAGALDNGAPQFPEVSNQAAAPPQAGASFFPSSPFEAQQDTAGKDSVPEALQPIKTKTSKGGGEDPAGARVQPYSADLN